jgi:hypothetical protein
MSASPFTPPKAYRVYCFDIGRKTVTADFIKAASDEEAIAKAEEAYPGCKCEVWDSKRLVAQLEPERRQA